MINLSIYMISSFSILLNTCNGYVKSEIIFGLLLVAIFEMFAFKFLSNEK